MQDVSGDVGKPEIAAAIAIGQLSVIDAHQVQDGGVDVVDVDRLLDRLEAEFVGGAVDRAAFHRAAGQPHGESEGIVIAAALGAVRHCRRLRAPACGRIRIRKPPACPSTGRAPSDP